MILVSRNIRYAHIRGGSSGSGRQIQYMLPYTCIQTAETVMGPPSVASNFRSIQCQTSCSVNPWESIWILDANLSGKSHVDAILSKATQQFSSVQTDHRHEVRSDELVKTLVHQYTNLKVYTLSHQKPVKIVTNGRSDTVPFPLLYNQTGSSVQHQLKRTKVNGSGLV